MATVTKTWVFASNAEGLTDVGVSARPFSYDGSNGSPSNGSVLFGGGYPSATEIGRSGTGVTWETWGGVPAGSIITNAQITAYKYRALAGSGILSINALQTIKIRVVNSSNTTVHSAGELISTTTAGVADTGWTAGSAGTSRAVDASYQASTTAIKIELESNSGSYEMDDGEGGSLGSDGFSLYLDTIELTITYTAAATGIPKHSDHYRRLRQ